MIPEFGQLSLIMAMLLSICLAVIPMAGSFNGKFVWMASARSLATGMWVFVALSFAVLAYAFLVDDFSVKYVAGHSNSDLPNYYKFTAVWGGHEGSMLLWVLMLASWTLAVSIFSKNLPIDILARVLSVLGLISLGFFLFMLFTSNPFDRLLPNVPRDGSDLNPLLQDPGMIYHPPMLYMGYVGFAVVFAFSIAALLSGRVDSAWARWARPWTNLAWCFLTLGLALGSWWAYYELGWGGWWFWDPVENAAFMPWLVGTALIHTLAMTEKRGVFKNLTLFLALFAFSLSLLGTFLVRSGVLTSVHAFATDPERGIFILAFLLFVVGGSLILFALRAPVVKSLAGFSLFSRESFLLANSILFIITACLVLLGTLFPLVVDALGKGKISVGPPWFNYFFIKIMAVVSIMMGVGLMLNWKKTKMSRLRKYQAGAVVCALLTGLLVPLTSQPYSFAAFLGAAISSWVIYSCIADLIRKCANSDTLFHGMAKLTASYYGMMLAHIGFGVCALGVTLNSVYSDQRDIRLTIGVPIQAAGYEYELAEVIRVKGPNYSAFVGEVIVRRDGEQLFKLKPEKRNYNSGGNIMTEAAIDAGFFRDIYVALGEKINNTDWALRIHYKPMVRWIWFGALFMGLGGCLAIADKRYKLRVKKRTEANEISEDAKPASVQG